ncbi:DNA repair protein RecO [Paenirhodobacter sp.]|uniref:DNA repair protein RecO n=1 Tax=Paenirhodobacter sp. TaxID=1965326 RepID=UPI003B500FBC
MDWQDEGTVLSARPHGDTSMIVDAFTLAHGRHAGVVRGGASRRMAAALQPGSHLRLGWRARLEDHLGSYTAEQLASRAGAMADRLALLGLGATCAMVAFALPERAPHPALYHRTEALFDRIGAVAEGWPLDYLRWEMALLEELGFGLDLSRCAVNGSRDDLAYVSPRTGRAVSRTGAGDWAPKLLALPQCLLGQGPASPTELIQGLRLTGHFLTLFAEEHGRRLPEARNRLIAALERLA